MTKRREFWLIFILLVVIIILVSFISFFNVNVEQADAKRFVQEDLKSKYPNADTEILSLIEKRDDKGQKYFEVKVRITKFSDTACPERFHTYYNYPKQNFVTPPDEVITRDCAICVNTGKACSIAFPEEAIIASHTLTGTEQIDQFIRDKISVRPQVMSTANSWIVVWDSDVSSFFYEVELSRNGTILSINKRDKDI